MLRAKDLLRIGLLALVGAASPAAAKGVLTIAAAANVRPALEEIRAAFERSAGISTVVSYGASGVLERQIEQGAPFDVFLSADASFVDRLARAGRIARGSRLAYAIGTLAAASAPGRPPLGSIADLRKPAYARIAVAKPEIAPYGRAAMEALERSGIAAAVKNRLVFTESVRDAIRYVSSGDADAGFVAESEAMESNLARIVVPRDLYPPIRQEAAAIVRPRAAPEAPAFVRFLASPSAKEIWRRCGYGLP